MTKKWKTGDTLIAKSSFAKVVASDLSGEQNWVKVRYQNQDFEGYQSEFEAKGWKKISPVLGCGCLTIGAPTFFIILGSLFSAPEPQVQTQTSPTSPVTQSPQTQIDMWQSVTVKGTLKCDRIYREGNVWHMGYLETVDGRKYSVNGVGSQLGILPPVDEISNTNLLDSSPDTYLEASRALQDSSNAICQQKYPDDYK